MNPQDSKRGQSKSKAGAQRERKGEREVLSYEEGEQRKVEHEEHAEYEDDEGEIDGKPFPMREEQELETGSKKRQTLQEANEGRTYALQPYSPEETSQQTVEKKSQSYTKNKRTRQGTPVSRHKVTQQEHQSHRRHTRTWGRVNSEVQESSEMDSLSDGDLQWSDISFEEWQRGETCDPLPSQEWIFSQRKDDQTLSQTWGQGFDERNQKERG